MTITVIRDSMSITLCLKEMRQLWQAVVSTSMDGLILIIFGQQHHHTFGNDTHVQLSLSLHFYLLHLILSICNEKFSRHSVLP